MICEKNKSVGCFACYNVCPKNAIEMIEDECGYIYPSIIKEKCINCNLCKKVCPAINEIDSKYPIKCYAARVKDKDIISKSTSGGIATILSKKILENDGIVYGASYLNDCNVSHIRVDNANDLHKLQGSKYVHSYINETYKLVKKDLSENKKVLFIGTPCQIAGLKKFLINEYPNLYLVDIICHGVPSQRFLKDEVKRVNNNNLNIDRVNFRDKSFSSFTFSINKNDKILYFQEWIKNPYFYSFMKSITYRENCYDCKYANPNRISDITIGDFWGLGRDSAFYATRGKGISVILPITDKGLQLIKEIDNEIDKEERDVKEAINGNDQLKSPSNKSEKVNVFKEAYKKNNNFFKTYKKICGKNYYKQLIKSNLIVKKLLKIRDGVRNGKK